MTVFAFYDFLPCKEKRVRLNLFVIAPFDCSSDYPAKEQTLPLRHRVNAPGESNFLLGGGHVDGLEKGESEEQKVIESMHGRGGEYYAFCTGVEYFLCAIVFTAIIIASCTTLNGWLVASEPVQQ